VLLPLGDVSAASNGGRNDFPVSVGTGGVPGASPVHIAGAEATLWGSLACVTPLLASVGPCSRPDLVPITASIAVSIAPRWQAAWWPKSSRGGAMSGSEHGSTLTSSVWAEVRELILATVATGCCGRAAALSLSLGLSHAHRPFGSTVP
jgi:hypothetical protein